MILLGALLLATPAPVTRRAAMFALGMIVCFLCHAGIQIAELHALVYVGGSMYGRGAWLLLPAISAAPRIVEILIAVLLAGGRWMAFLRSAPLAPGEP
jgi:hypothetical protein